MKRNQLTAGLLALILTGTPLPTTSPVLTVSAAEESPTAGTCGENVTWNLNTQTGTLTISGTGYMTSHPWEPRCAQIQTVVIGNGVLSIDYAAFAECSLLTSVTIPDSVCSIEENAFLNCIRLSSVTLPAGMEFINEMAFSGCESLTAITIPDGVVSIRDNAFDGCKHLASVTFPDTLEYIGDMAFQNCDKLTEVVLPECVGRLEPGVFYACDALTSLTVLNPYCIFPGFYPLTGQSDGTGAAVICGYEHSTAQLYAENSDTPFQSLGKDPGTAPIPSDYDTEGYCGENATWTYDFRTATLTISGEGEMLTPTFYKLDDLIGTVVVGDGVTTIASDTFAGCPQLQSVSLPDSVTVIGDGAFRSCRALTDINLPDSMTQIGEEAFIYCEALKDITIPKGVTRIGAQAFKGTAWLAARQAENPLVVVNGLLLDGTACKGDTIIPDGVTAIASHAFYYNQTITSVTIPDSVTSIGKQAFYNCDALASVSLPNSRAVIGAEAFWKCTALTQVIIPEKLAGVEKSAFHFCKKLSTVIIRNPDCELYDSTSTFANEWDDAANAATFSGRICGYSGSTAEAYAVKYNRTFLPLDAAGNPIEPTDPLKWTFNESTGTLQISGEGDMIDVDWSAYSDTIRKVVIGEGVTSIAAQAFQNCTALTSVTLPASLTSIGDNAFYGCKALKSINQPVSLTSLGKQAFYGCESLTSVKLPDSLTVIQYGTFMGCKALTSVTIPERVTAIKEYAFAGCTALKIITIPASVNKIDYLAFMDCASLESVIILNPDCNIFDDADTFYNQWDSDAQKSIFTGTIVGAEDSTAQAYAEKYGYHFQDIRTLSVSAEPEPESPSVGDINGDGRIDASDASELLIALANAGAGLDSGLTAAQIARVDVDGNNRRNAADAAVILQYAAYRGAGGTETIADFLAAEAGGN